MTGVSYWQQAWAKSTPPRRYLTQPSGFQPLFERYLPRASGDLPVDFLEIGCYPGRYLYLFAKEFGYRVAGVDFLPEAAAIPDWLAELGVAAQVTVADFFTFQPGRGYDVVASFGFVEHFPYWQEVLQRHLALLNPGGYLIIEFPHLARGQYWLRRFLNPQFFKAHYLEGMDPAKWRQALEAHGIEVLYCDYFQTFRVWSEVVGRGPVRWVRKLVLKLTRFVHKTLNRLRIDYPNRYFSPFIVIIGRRPA
jgi:SAM-dependent methyltransferase